MQSSYSASDSAAFDPRAFALKGGLFPLTLLEILQYDLDVLRRELALKAKQAPDFFRQAPVILSVDGIADQGQIDLAAVREICQESGLIIVALREAGPPLNARARELNLAVLPRSRARTVGHQPSELEFGAAKAQSQASAGHRQTEVRPVEPPPPEPAVDIPVLTEQLAETPAQRRAERAAGQPAEQHVFAHLGKDVAIAGDLIVAAPVSAGAELLADGNIHVYGALRGRALAGVNGDEKARIFCQSMEAELVSISGNFKLEESLSSEYRGKAVMIYLEDKVLKVQPLASRDR